MPTKKPNPYKNPLELLRLVLQSYSQAEVDRRFTSDGEGLDEQEVISVERLHTTEDMLDMFSFSDGTNNLPKPETEEWWTIYQWHPVKKQLIRGEDLRAALHSVVKDHVTNHTKITDQIIVGSDLCKGESCPVHSPVFRQMHIAAEIDLELEHDEPVTPKLDVYLRLPTANHQAPTQAQLRIAVQVIREIVSQGKNIYIHCQNGHGRAPTVVAAYFIYYGHLTVADAIEKVKIKRPEIHLEPEQIKALEEFSKS